MTNKKKYLILFAFIIILLIFISAIKNKKSSGTLEDSTERSSEDYKITEDIVILNIPQEQDSQIESSQNEELSQEENLKINALTLFSSDFQDLESIPSKFTCDGENINPNLEISGVDEKAKSLVLIMDDPDAPDGVWDHWIKFNIPVATRNIKAGEDVEGISGKGTGGNLDYTGPCPPDGKHRYVFKLYAIDTELTLSEGSSKAEVEEAIEGHILQETKLTGAYEREIDLIEKEEGNSATTQTETE